MKLNIVDKRSIAADVVQVRLARGDNGELPTFEPGAHIELKFASMSRRYSLTSMPQDRSCYEIRVLKAPRSRGGSVYIHDRLDIGDMVEVDGPFNGFRLDRRVPHAVFIAGGIGITPFYTMIRALRQDGMSYELHYAARSKERLLPVHDLGRDRVSVCLSEGFDGDVRALDLARLMQGLRRDAHIYVCGPQRMIESVRTIARRQEWPEHALHMESFGSVIGAGDRPLTVHLSVSQTVLQVEPGTSILQAMLDHGVWASYECTRGECGSCYVGVTNGDVDHRDVCLSPEQRSQGMCVCVSWARSQALTIEA